MGAGTPTEVSLMAIDGCERNDPDDDGCLEYRCVCPAQRLQLPAGHPRTQYRSSLLIYTNNIFNLTTYSRSPDLNIFGQPKMALIPVNSIRIPIRPPALQFAWNLATLQYLKELFPSQKGTTGTSTAGVLPALSFTDNYSQINSTSANNLTTTNTYTSVKWPLAFMALLPTGGTLNPSAVSALGDNSPWDNGMLIANSLAVPMPQVSKSSGRNFLNVNCDNQLCKQVFAPPDRFDRGPDNRSRQQGFFTRYRLQRAPVYLFLAYGVSRLAQWPARQRDWAQSQAGQNSDGIHRPRIPAQSMVMVQTRWLVRPSNRGSIWNFGFPPGFPARLFFTNFSWVYGTYVAAGTGGQSGVINCQDYGVMSATNWNGTTGSNVTLNTQQPGILPKLPSNAGWGTNSAGPPYFTNQVVSSPPDGLSDSYSYWHNNLLQNDVGVDWAGNNPSAPDSDQYLAAKYHPSYYVTNGSTATWTGMFPRALRQAVSKPYPWQKNISERARVAQM